MCGKKERVIPYCHWTHPISLTTPTSIPDDSRVSHVTVTFHFYFYFSHFCNVFTLARLLHHFHLLTCIHFLFVYLRNQWAEWLLKSGANLLEFILILILKKRNQKARSSTHKAICVCVCVEVSALRQGFSPPPTMSLSLSIMIFVVAVFIIACGHSGNITRCACVFLCVCVCFGTV